MDNEIYAGFLTQCAAVEANVVVCCFAPIPAGIVLIIDFPALIFFVQAGLRALFCLSVEIYDPVCPIVHICVDENMQSILTIF